MWPAKITYVNNRNSQPYARIAYDDRDRDDPFASRKSPSRITVDIFDLPDKKGGSRSADDEEFIRITSAEVAKIIAAAGDRARRDPDAANFLDVLAMVGRYTTVVDAVAGHQDHFSSSDGDLFGAPPPCHQPPRAAALPPAAQPRPRLSAWNSCGSENKMVVPLGPPSSAAAVAQYLAQLDGAPGPVVPAALAFPRYKVATICCAEDVELHHLFT